MKLVIRRVLNLMLYLSLCVMVGTGLLMAFRLIPGSRGGGGLEVLGWNRHQWGDLHTWVSYIFILLIVIHMAINWLWLLRVAAQGRIWRIVLGLLAGIAIVGVFFFLPVKDRKMNHGGGRQSHRVSAEPEPIK